MFPDSQQPLAPIPVEKVGIPIPPDQVTPEMRMNAIGSPDRAGAGVLRTPEQIAALAERASGVGETVTGGSVEVDASSVETPVTATPQPEKFVADAAAVRPEKPPVTGGTSLRPGYWKAATPEQVARAAGHGFDLEQANKKYYPHSAAKQ